MNGHVYLYKFTDIGNLLEAHTANFYQSCFGGRMELQGGIHFLLYILLHHFNFFHQACPTSQFTKAVWE